MDYMKELLIDQVLQEDMINNNKDTQVEPTEAKSSSELRGPYSISKCNHPTRRLTNCFHVTIGLKKMKMLDACGEEITSKEKMEEYYDDGKDLSRLTNDVKADQTLPLDENTSIASEELVILESKDTSINSSFNLSINSEDLANFEKKSSAAHSTDSDVEFDLNTSTSSNTSVPVAMEEPKLAYRTEDILARYSNHLTVSSSKTMDLKNANHEVFSSSSGDTGNQIPRKVIGKSKKSVKDKAMAMDIQKAGGSNKYKSVSKKESNMNQSVLKPELKEKPSFQCNECPNTYTTKFNLKKHQTQHTGRKLHQCNQCAKSFDKIGELKIHMENHGKV